MGGESGPYPLAISGMAARCALWSLYGTFLERKFFGLAALFSFFIFIIIIITPIGVTEQGHR